MLTSNYFSYNKSKNTGDTGAYTLKGTDGANKSILAFSNSYVGETWWNSKTFGQITLMVGTGTTAPSNADYNIENSVSQYLGSQSLVLASTENSFSATITATFTNTSGADISITEFGIAKNFYLSSPSNRAYVLLMREVLETPIVVAAGTSVPLEFAWRDVDI